MQCLCMSVNRRISSWSAYCSCWRIELEGWVAAASSVDSACQTGWWVDHRHCIYGFKYIDEHTHTHPFNGPLSGLPGWAGTRKVKLVWILLKQETVSGSGISWAICKSAPRSRQITMPAPHCSVFYRPDALPAAQPTASKHWRQEHYREYICEWVSQQNLADYMILYLLCHMFSALLSSI